MTRLASAPDMAHTHRDGELSSTVSLTRFSGCNRSAEVLFSCVDGSGHSVRSTAPVEPEGWAASGRRNRDIDTAAVPWDFFEAHRLAAAPSAH